MNLLIYIPTNTIYTHVRYVTWFFDDSHFDFIDKELQYISNFLFFHFVKDTNAKKEIRKSMLLNIEAEKIKTENSLFSKKHSN